MRNQADPESGCPFAAGTSLPPASEAPEIGEALRTAFDAAPIGMILADASGRIVCANGPACRMFGYSAEMLIGRPVELLVPERQRRAHAARRSDFQAAPVARTMGCGRNLTGLRADGREFPVEIGIGGWQEQGRALTCLTLVDQTDRCRSELLLRDANARLEQFVCVASHDLRSPLRGMALVLESLREGLGDNGNEPRVARDLDRLDCRIQRMAELVEDLLGFARSTGGARLPESILLEDVVGEVLALQDVPEGFAFSLDLPAEAIVATRIALSTVLRNLVSNAIKHHDRAEGHIRIDARFEDEACVIDVSDDGPGIPAHARERVFQLFKTLARDDSRSSGMGLTVALQLATLNGGGLAILDREDGQRGVTMRVTWPRFARTDHEY